jgi:hypothetical protein
MAVHGTQGTGVEGCCRDVHTEQLVAERVDCAQACLQGGELTTRLERSNGGKGERTSWDGAV